MAEDKPSAGAGADVVSVVPVELMLLSEAVAGGVDGVPSAFAGIVPPAD
jgi:hypothetical protein